jgi:hypothetical protein
MLLEYVPQQRDDFEAAAARFPGEAARPHAAWSPGRVRAVGWVAVAVVLLTTALLLLPRRSPLGGSVFAEAMLEADRIDHPAFVIGLVTVAIGGAMVVVPLAYALALRRSPRPLTGYAVRIELGEDAVAVFTPGNELTVAWTGVVAFAETRHLFVLKTVSDLRVVLPKRAADPDALRTLLRGRVAPMACVAAVPSPRLAA